MKKNHMDNLASLYMYSEGLTVSIWKYYCWLFLILDAFSIIVFFAIGHDLGTKSLIFVSDMAKQFANLWGNQGITFFTLYSSLVGILCAFSKNMEKLHGPLKFMLVFIPIFYFCNSFLLHTGAIWNPSETTSICTVQCLLFLLELDGTVLFFESTVRTLFRFMDYHKKQRG